MEPTGFPLAPISPAWRLALSVVFLMAGSPGRSQEPRVLRVWTGAVPGDDGPIGRERVRAPTEAPMKDVNSAVMYLALMRAGGPAELHVYAQGGRGFGVRKSALPCCTWTDRFAAWLQSQGMLRTNAQAK